MLWSVQMDCPLAHSPFSYSSIGIHWCVCVRVESEFKCFLSLCLRALIIEELFVRSCLIDEGDPFSTHSIMGSFAISQM